MSVLNATDHFQTYTALHPDAIEETHIYAQSADN